MHVYIGLSHTLVYDHEYDYECGHSIILCICVLVLGVVYVHGIDVLGVCGSNPTGTAPVTHEQQLEAHIPQVVLSGGGCHVWFGCVGVWVCWWLAS